MKKIEIEIPDGKFWWVLPLHTEADDYCEFYLPTLTNN